MVHNVVVGVYEAIPIAGGEMAAKKTIATLKDPGMAETEVELEVLEVVNIEPCNVARFSHE